MCWQKLLALVRDMNICAPLQKIQDFKVFGGNCVILPLTLCLLIRDVSLGCSERACVIKTWLRVLDLTFLHHVAYASSQRRSLRQSDPSVHT